MYGDGISSYCTNNIIWILNCVTVCTMHACPNIIVKQCMFTAFHNTNNIIGYKLFLKIYMYIYICLIWIKNSFYNVANIHLYLQSNVNCVHKLSLARNNHVFVEGFGNDENNCIIDYIAIR